MKRLFRWWPVSLLGAVIVAGGLALAPSELAARTPAAIPDTPLSMSTLVRMDTTSLETLYRGGSVGPHPTGFFPGKAIPPAGSTRATARRSGVIGVLWKGKEFSDGAMINRLALGQRAVKADMFEGESWFDGQPSIILDYANTSRRFATVRDEMREVSPGLYLGMTYTRKPTGAERSMFYTLQQPQDHGHAKKSR